MRTIIAAMFTFAASTVYGCTICDTAAGSAVRAGIFNGSFFITFIEVVSAFPVLGLALYVVDRCLPD